MWLTTSLDARTLLVTGLFLAALFSLALLFLTRVLSFVARQTAFDHKILDGELTHRLANDVLDDERLNGQNGCAVFRRQLVQELTEPGILRARAGTPLAALPKDPARPSRTAGLVLVARHGFTGSRRFKYRPSAHGLQSPPSGCGSCYVFSTIKAVNSHVFWPKQVTGT